MAIIIDNTAVYAFIGWIGSILIYVSFLLWAFAPESFLHSIGITYYPSRYYAIALPAYFLVMYILLGLSYMGYNMLNTHDSTSLSTVSDVYTLDAPNEFLKCSLKEGIPNFGDIHPKYISLNLIKKNH